jgi:hypothetical protein
VGREKVDAYGRCGGPISRRFKRIGRDDAVERELYIDAGFKVFD